MLFRSAHLPSLICALCPAPLPSLLLCPREQGAPPPSADAHRLFRGRRCARAPFSATVSFALPSATRDTLRCALSLLLRLVHAHQSSSCAVGAPPSSTRGSTAPLPFSKRPRVRTRGEHPSHAVISPSIIPAPAQLLARVSCAAAEPFLPRSVFSGAPVSVMRPRSCSPCRTERV